VAIITCGCARGKSTARFHQRRILGNRPVQRGAGAPIGFRRRFHSPAQPAWGGWVVLLLQFACNRATLTGVGGRSVIPSINGATVGGGAPGVPRQVRRGEAVRAEAIAFTIAAYGGIPDPIHVVFRTASPSPAARRALGNGGDAFLARRVVAACRRDGHRSRSPVRCRGIPRGRFAVHRPYGVDRAAWRTAGGNIRNGFPKSPNPGLS
jgi:hypothetical protein